MASVKSFAVQGLVMLCAYIGLLAYKQDSIIYMPRGYSAKLNRQTLLPNFNVETLRFKTDEDGSQTAVLVKNVKGGCKRLFLTFGGNAMLARNWLEVLKGLPKAPGPGVCFLLVDYPGFGDSEGSPSQASILRVSHQALLEALHELRGQGDAEIQESEPELGAWGHSIGCAAALALAEHLARTEESSKMQMQHLVLSAPFTSLSRMAKELLPILKPVPLAPIDLIVSRHRWDNLGAVQQMASTTLPRVDIAHGLQDEIVPFAMGEELWQSLKAHSSRGSFTQMTAGHNDLLSTQEYGDWLLRMLV